MKSFGTGYTRYALGLLVMVSFANAADRSVLTALLEPIKQDLQLNDTQLGLISGIAFSLFFAILGVPFARWADMGSRRTLLTFTVGLWSIMTALSGYAQTFLQMFLARVGVGIGEAGGGPAAFSMLGDLYAPDRRGFASALFLIGGILGGAIGVWGGTVIAANWGWRIAFIAMGLPGVMLALLLKTTLREPRVHCRFPTLSDVFGRDAKEIIYRLLSKPTFLNAVIGFTLLNIFYLGAGPFSISFFVRGFDISLEDAGAMFGLVMGGSLLLGTFFGGWVANRAGKRSPRGYLILPAIALLLMSPLYILMYTVDSVHAALTAYAFAGLLFGTVAPSLFACIFGISGSENRTMGVALMGLFVTLIGGGLGPLFIGAVSDLLNVYLGEQSLRGALLIATGFVPAAAYFLYLASKTILEDFEDS